MNSQQLAAVSEPRSVNRAWPLVYIVLVSWNTQERTLACLSNLSGTSYPNYRMVVVDNASSDGSPDAIAMLHPNVPMLRLTRNRGFTGANNKGFSYAIEHGAEFVYLLNTDTRVPDDFLYQAVMTAQRDPTIGIVGSKVLHAHRPDTIQFAGAHLNITIAYSGRALGYDELDRGQYDCVTDVDWVTGCAMMLSHACIVETNGFDDAFFAFYEDVDICVRARSAGIRVVMSPGSRVWHEGGGSLGGAASGMHLYYDVRNALRLTYKHRPASNMVTETLRTACIVGAHMMQVFLQGPRISLIRAIFDGMRDYYRGVNGARRTH